MRTTISHGQTPNMHGKKYYMFSCLCCSARNVVQEENKKIALREAQQEMADWRNGNAEDCKSS